MGRENSARAPTLHMSLLCCAALDHSVTSNSLSPHGLVAHQASLSMGFSRQEYWSALPCHSPGDLPNLGIEPRSPTLQVDSLPSEPPGKLMNTKVRRLSLLQGIPSPGDLPNPGIELGCPAWQVDYLPAELPGKPI